MTDFAEIFGKYTFYHVLEVAPGVFTPGYRDFVPGQRVVLNAMKKLQIAGRRVLDIGCRDGLFSFEAERRGAGEVIGIDNDLSPAATEFLIPHFRSKVRMLEMNLYDLAPDEIGLFDVVLFPGVLYHLRYPIWGLKKILSVLKNDGQLIVETGILDGLEDHALMYCPIGRDSPYEATSITFFNVKGLSDTLFSLGTTVREVLFLEPRAIPPMAYVERPRGPVRSAASSPLPVRPLLPEKLPINRGTFLCDITRDVINPAVAKYWDLAHSMHTGR